MLLGEQRHNGCKTVTRQRRGCDLNPGLLRLCLARSFCFGFTSDAIPLPLLSQVHYKYSSTAMIQLRRCVQRRGLRRLACKTSSSSEIRSRLSIRQLVTETLTDAASEPMKATTQCRQQFSVVVRLMTYCASVSRRHSTC